MPDFLADYKPEGEVVDFHDDDTDGEGNEEYGATDNGGNSGGWGGMDSTQNEAAAAPSGWE